MKLTVTLNGTKTNPYHKFCLIPQIAQAEYDRHVLTLQKLGGDPIPDTAYIRKVLTGWSEEFVNLCCSKFQLGKMVKFTVEFNERS